ncbi:TPA: DMT family transporter [Stenotrophomonas maltophilia]|uniref:DMT family transporter n=1 Tax=Stenotrophomonas maltophilia TaxID=40324 RepID=UPI0014633474|nr:DMT family transporter [Stenotrophomonas maltophilia]MBH1381235.1 DMT family transporter [Stenotrophomonas maltophilia]MBH1397710.1 DMT family transporter [Stenotrophomonas maltophilia]MBH1470106.1 DMT family transporter [Stenotrophomonas maltophilia]MBH1473458.1 DMT family transporter [Stenotrophomonas maltophilia]QJP21390.1 DMT family transporter [Stenotrophomonas maltophilia]
MNVQRSPSRAVAWMVAAVACFSLMDAGMKQLSASYPTLEVTFLRGAASLPFVLMWVLVSAGPRSLVPRRWGLHLLRGALGMAMIGCFVFALRDLPLSTAYTIYFVAPLLIAALSVPLLGERVGPRRWVAIGIGLVGVLVVLRPGVDGFISVPGLMVLAAATAYAVAAITVSLLTRTDTSQSMVVWFLVIMAIGAGLLAIPGWVPLQLAHAPLIAGMGLAGALGQIALTKAFQLGEASMIAPLEYSGLVWVIGWDLAFWGQLPDGYTWVGAAIIVASGLYLLHRERVNRQEPPKPLDHP